MASKILLLTPTQTELEKVRPAISFPDRDDVNVKFAVCGFGPVAAASQAARMIDKFSPTHVIVVGTAASLDDSFPVGRAFACSEVTIDGIGAGTGESFESAEDMGWDFLDADQQAIGSRLTLQTRESDALLVTACAASASEIDADNRRTRFPGAVAEDMETFAVAFAAASAKLPMISVRGIRSVAGDMDEANWKSEEALSSAAELANRVINDLRESVL